MTLCGWQDVKNAITATTTTACPGWRLTLAVGFCVLYGMSRVRCFRSCISEANGSLGHVDAEPEMIYFGRTKIASHTFSANPFKAKKLGLSVLCLPLYNGDLRNTDLVCILVCTHTKDTFPKTGHTASWNLIPNQERTTASSVDTVSIKCRSPKSALRTSLPENLPETSRTGRLSQRTRRASDKENAHEKIQLHWHTMCEGFQRKHKHCLWQLTSRPHTTEGSIRRWTYSCNMKSA